VRSPVTFDASFALAFSSLRCSRLMLRQPSESPSTRRGEGCSSTAFDFLAIAMKQVWNNPAGRGSCFMAIAKKSAVP